ncbi:hypothetical protein QS306_01510 [Paraburkholderia bonniea]|uniref:hypothetical protein n=1 Tax=Paraburkholderia bonniea TaxID=2152891 RepID=UPI001291562E|nr:hypothetical protein [Paraburkholderia bonniea]WJF90389.1 hypothetical protein QS306_01510 [Paraburkholderia bonniea]WJF93704.1 hypothetical protein QS308_01510 [Paraburkholderia bonniea]
MNGLVSYPRTEGTTLGDVPRAAFANLPEPLRSRVIARERHRRDAFAAANPGKEFLVRAYVSPEKFAEVRDAFIHDDDAALRGFPEPGAQAGSVPVYSFALDSSVNETSEAMRSLFRFDDPKRKGDVHERLLNTFQHNIRSAQELSDDTVVWRFIGANYTPQKDGRTAFTCNKIGGDFWGIGPIPHSEAHWRSSCAIPGTWNGDGGYVAFRLGDLPMPVRSIFRDGLYGQTAPQSSMAPGHYFPGGAEQLIVDARRLDTSPEAKTFFAFIPIQRSAWNQS